MRTASYITVHFIFRQILNLAPSVFFSPFSISLRSCVDRRMARMVLPNGLNATGRLVVNEAGHKPDSTGWRKKNACFLYLPAISFFGVTSDQRSTFENLVQSTI